MNWLAFGLNYAPCGAIQTMNTLADQNQYKFPDAATVIKRDTYVDDVTSGSHDTSSALQLQSDLMNVLQSAKFYLKKWASNSNKILLAVPESSREVQVPLSLNPDKSIKTLGIHWKTTTDTLSFCVNYNNSVPVTKRFALSTIAKIYDPLGLVSPVVCKAKIFIKMIWRCKLDWDDPLPDELLKGWNTLASNLPLLSDISIDRWLRTNLNSCSIELHGFCDASFEAYGAVVYLRITDSSTGEVSSSIIMSKSKITPSSLPTIPRLELCAALLLAKLMKYIILSFRVISIQLENCRFWTDSEVVLHWLRGEAGKWKIFVANRVQKINVNLWNHVSTKENPADYVSRGLLPSQLNKLWFHGPSWLTEDKKHWPITNKFGFDFDESLITEELRQTVSSEGVVSETPMAKLLRYCSRYMQLLRYSAWYRRFFQYLRDKHSINPDHLSVVELRESSLR